MLVVYFIALYGFALGYDFSHGDKYKIQKLCLDQDKCDECLQADPRCNWCYEEEYQGRRCNVAFTFPPCNPDKIEKNVDVEVETEEKNTNNSDNTNMEAFQQIHPKEIRVKLRKGIPVNFTFTYTPAANYPLELYYLGDLSGTMKPSLDNLKILGNNLKISLANLTKNYKLAYGSFVDKPDMPFYFTDPESLKNPCFYQFMEDCEQTAYLFQHRLSFTEDTQKFSAAVNKSGITSNVDDPEGTLDAILQILVCEEKIGWSKNSRKMIILPTDSLLHTAGDGKLVGALLKPTETCLLDDAGNHIEPLKYDYPDLGQIVDLLKKKKVNIIFAVKEGPKKDYYISLSETLLKDYGYTTTLDEKSENILQIIEEGYYNFAGQVNFYINTTFHPHIDVKFYADCKNENTYNESSSCYGVKNNSVKFKVILTLKDYPDNEQQLKEDLLYVEEKNLNEKVEINVSYLGLCKCKNITESGRSCGNNGRRSCGDCICTEGWTGKNCSVNCADNLVVSCRQQLDDGSFSYCSGNGECVCGKCKCKPPYEGKLCEFKCPFNNEICSGPTRGKCHEGNCICEAGYKGEDCSCSLSTDDCIFDGMECSGKGTCECNQCKCEEGFSGKYCESSKDHNNTICERYDSTVENRIEGESLLNDSIQLNNHSIVMIEVEDLEKSNCGETCTLLVFKENKRCEVSYCYYDENKSVYLPIVKRCSLAAGFKMTREGIWIILGTIVAGAIFILIWKCKRDRDDRIEYEKFMNTPNNFHELNPVYKSPVTTYRNPLSGRD